MKVRNGFVSNSSSSSFVIGKNFMTEEQSAEFSKFLNEYHVSGDCLEDTYIFESPFYFFGEISIHDTEVMSFLKKVGVDTKYVSILS